MLFLSHRWYGSAVYVFVLIFILFSLMPLGAFSQDTTGDTTQERVLDELIILGSRGGQRLQMESPVPVDVIDISKMVQEAPQPDLGSILTYTHPSFTATPQTIADGTDHVDPASLRGLAPDQTLVLINGKRRHTSALININSTFGRGSVATDINTIPSLAIGKIEVLRDGAAAQYGSDAVAGVINVSLRKEAGTKIIFTTGTNITQFESYTEAGKGDFQRDIAPKYVKNFVLDGQVYQLGVNQGWRLGKKGGFFNITGFVGYRAPTNRSGEGTGSITSMASLDNAVNPTQAQDEAYMQRYGVTRKDIRGRMGQSEVVTGQVFFNGSVPVKASGEFYFFGGLSYKNGSAAALYRKPGVFFVNTALYPAGFLPKITSALWDPSLSLGFRKEINGWHIDGNNTIGMSAFIFGLSNSTNTTASVPANVAGAGNLRIDSAQSEFDAGGLFFIQNTASIDATKKFDVLKGLNVAFGGLYRYEQYRQEAGELSSWANFNRRTSQDDTAFVNIEGVYVLNSATTSRPGRDGLGERKYTIPGTQGFTGIGAYNVIRHSRHNIGMYVDLDQHFTKHFLLNAAGRFEYYSDFGSNISAKLSTRVKLNQVIAFRAALSTGFRAPSLQQRYLFITSLRNTGGTLIFTQGTFPNQSPLAQAVGIAPLQPEISQNASLGVTVNMRRFKFTFDGYYIRINNRVVYTGQFNATPQIKPIFDQFDVARASFFINGMHSQTFGADLVASYSVPLERPHNLLLSLTGNYTHTAQVGATIVTDKLKNQEDRLLSPSSKSYLFESIPRYKGFFVVDYHYQKFGFVFRESLFGQTAATGDNGNNYYQRLNADGSEVTGENYIFRQVIPAVALTDITFTYKFNPALQIALGVNNLWDTYTQLISGLNGRFHRIQNDPNQPDYLMISKEGIDAKAMGWHHNDRITSGLLLGNQINYARGVSMIGLNGRYLFARLTVQL